MSKKSLTPMMFKVVFNSCRKFSSSPTRFDVNKVILIGNVGNISVRNLKTKENESFVKINMATNKKLPDGSKKTTWHNVCIFGHPNTISFASKSILVGSKIYVEGYLETKEYEKDGIKKYATDIVARNFEVLNKKEQNMNTTEPIETSESKRDS
jgi:single-strand DNA-binding protein